MQLTFEEFVIDTTSFELRRGDQVCPVEPLVFDLVLYLARNAQRLVSRDELIEHVWSGRIVSDATISSCIKAARQALGDSGNEQRLIRTVRSRGFQFLADVSEGSAEEAAAPPAPAVAATSTVTTPPVTDIKIDLEPDYELPKRPSIAVLPFETLNQGADDDNVFADGLTHDIISRISKLRWLFVIARGSTFTFRRSTDSVEQIARALGVRYVAHGTVRFAGNRVRVSAVLVDAVSRQEIWAEQFDRQIEDVFAIQDEISATIVALMETEIEEAEQRRALHSPVETLDAWSSYHRGLWHMHRFSKDSFTQAEHFFEKATEIDPNTPRAFAGLSFVHFQRHFLGLVADQEEALQRAFQFAEHSIALDPKDPLGHMALGRALLMRREYDHSIDELQMSIELNPNLAPAQFSLSRTLMAAGISQEGIEAADVARRLSPNDPMRFAMLSVRANCLAQLGEFEEAVKWVQQATHQSNAHFHILAIAVYIASAAGNLELAQKYKARLLQSRPDYKISDFFRGFPLRNKEHVDLVVDGLKRVGLPD